MRSMLLYAVAFFASISSTFAEDDPQQPAESPAVGLKLNQNKVLGCFKDPGSMYDMGVYTFQSMGWCQALCVRQSKLYGALVNGTNCFCGDNPPPNNAKVDDDECDTTCGGIDSLTCGGTNKWQVFNDGYKNGDPTGSIHITTPSQTYYFMKQTSTASANGQTKPSIVVVTQAQTTPTASASSSTSDSGNGGPNKAVIAVAVVVAVVAVAAIIGTVIFFIRHKKQKAFEEERRRHESMARFVSGEKPPSTYSLPDSRLEPSVMFQRRQSDGSIMDNQDYSRRILKVTNPDDR